MSAYKSLFVLIHPGGDINYVVGFVEGTDDEVLHCLNTDYAGFDGVVGLIEDSKYDKIKEHCSFVEDASCLGSQHHETESEIALIAARKKVVKVFCVEDQLNPSWTVRVD